jgi:hypothetical protein
MAKRLTPGWFGSSLREVLRTARLSVLLTVVWVPLTLSVLLAMVVPALPLGLVLLLLCLLIVGTLATWWIAAILQRGLAEHGLIANKLTADQLAKITGVVTVVSNMGGEKEKAFQKLVRNLPELKAVYAVTCPGEEGQVDLLRGWLEVTAPQVQVRHLHSVVDRHRPSDQIVAKLGQELRLIQGDGLVVDITTDNALCTVTLIEAVKGNGHVPATFLASNSPTHPYSDEFALVAVYDPTGTFEPEPAPIDAPTRRGAS